MARKSVKKERRLEILNAFMVCIARWGVQGASLARIAKESGIQRPALRHFVGNREALLRELCLHINKQAEESRVAIDKVFDEKGTTAIDSINSLVTQHMIMPTGTMNTIVALIDYAGVQDDDELNTLMKQWYENYLDWLKTVLRRHYKSTRSVDFVAVAIINAVMSHCVVHRVLDKKHTSDLTASLKLLLSTLTLK